jgi:hypothetical protein
MAEGNGELKGNSPESIKYRITPMLKTSTDSLYYYWRYISGGMKSKVPANL